MTFQSSELLDQFVVEARECLERIGRRLLEVERDPANAELLNDLFRAVHTLKGNCGLFDFKPLERVVHAGEDLLDRIRNGRLAYGERIADALLEAMDYTVELVDAIAEQGRLPEDADLRAGELAGALRARLDDGAPVAAAGRDAAPAGDAPLAAAAGGVDQVPDWVASLPPQARGPGLVAVRYRPEPECFFKGEDPWRHAQLTPGLRHLAVGTQAPWPAADVFDCYRCNLELVIVSDAPPAYVEEHFRYVPEQIELHVSAAPGAGAAPAVDVALATRRRKIAAIWIEQCTLLARPGVAAGTVSAVRRVFAHLLACRGDDDAVVAARGELQSLPPGAAALAAWAARHAPAGTRVPIVGAIEPGATGLGAGTAAAASGSSVAAIEPRRGASAADESAGAQKVVKVAQDKIDRLMDLIGEMVVAKNSLPYLAARAETVFGQRELSREIKAQYSVINRIAEDMQHAIMQVRMLPVGTIFQRFSRLVRDISKKLGKEVNLVIEGEGTEADKNVIESLADPLIHILRNSLDHGIELPAVRLAAGKPAAGTLKVSARQEGDRVLLDIVDDGAGIDTTRVRAKAVERGLIPADRADALTDDEAVQLVFLPGFSTAESISDLSGRGVGMDVVRSAVERVNGHVELASVRGRGTTVSLSLPLSMAVTNVMMIEAAGRRFGVPMDMIVETVRVPAEDIHRFKQAQTVVLRGRIVALRTLAGLLSLDDQARINADGEHAVLVVRIGAETIGLVVDDFHGTSDIILKPLEGVLAGLTGFAGTALMGDGSVLMILNPKELV